MFGKSGKFLDPLRLISHPYRIPPSTFNNKNNLTVIGSSVRIFAIFNPPKHFNFIRWKDETKRQKSDCNGSGAGDW
jgi:hypothetical protein